MSEYLRPSAQKRKMYLRLDASPPSLDAKKEELVRTNLTILHSPKIIVLHQRFQVDILGTALG